MPIDKIAHFTVSAAITLVAALWLSIPPVWAAVVTLLCGIGKELRDKLSPGNRWSWGDMVANAVGVLVRWLSW